MSWLLGTRAGRWLAMIAGAVALLAAAVLAGWSKRGQHEAGKALKEYKKTRERIDEVQPYNDTSDADRFLHDRKSRRDL